MKQKIFFSKGSPRLGSCPHEPFGDISYHYSSAKLYEFGIDEFGFLNNLYKVFDGD